MDASVPSGVAPSSQSTRKLLILTGVGFVVVFFCINDILGLINGGGIFSVISAMDAANKGQRIVDIDDAGLRIIFVAACSLVATAVAAFLRTDMYERVASALFVLSIIGGGCFLDAIFGPRITRGYMTAHGYVRCPARDQLRGHGKGSVWFDNYVLNRADCSPQRPRT